MNADRLFWLFSSLAFAFLVLFGCSRRDEVQGTDGGNSLTNKSSGVRGGGWKLASFADDAVLMRYGTNELTKGAVDRIINLRVKMYQIAMRNAQRIKRNEAFDARMLAALPVAFPRDCAIVNFAATNGIAASDEVFRLKRLGAMQSAGQGFLTWAAFLKKFTPEERSTLNERVKIEALEESVRRWHAKNKPANLPDEEIAGYRRRQREYNEMAAATNHLIFVNATNVWKSIQGGLAFEEAVRQFSTEEDKSANGEWGDFQLDYFKDAPEVRSAIKSLSVGQFTPPIESDNGLAIIRLDNKQTDNGGMVIYSLSRVFFHLPEFYPELSDAQFAKEIREARQDRLFEEFVTELVQKMPVTYPNGEKIFEEASRIASQPTLM